MKKRRLKGLSALLLAAALMAALPPAGIRAQQALPDQRTPAQVEAVRLLLDQGIAKETVEKLGPRAELAAAVLRSRKLSRTELDKLVQGLARYPDDLAFTSKEIEGMQELTTGELFSPQNQGVALARRMIDYKPIDITINSAPTVFDPWEEFHQPVYLNDQAYLPVYRMMTILGGDAEWNGISKNVTLIAPWQSRWKLKIGSKEVHNASGDLIGTLSGPALQVENQVLVPFDFWSAIMGFRSEWDSGRKSFLLVTEPLFDPDSPVEGYGGGDHGYIMPDLNVRLDSGYARLTSLPINYNGLIYYPLDTGAGLLGMTAVYDPQARRLALTTDKATQEKNEGVPVPPSPHLSGVPVDIIPSVQVSLDGMQTAADGTPLALSFPLVMHLGQVFLPVNELAALTGHQVTYSASDAEKTLTLTKPPSRRILEKLAPGVSRDDVRRLLGNSPRVVYDAADGTRSWEYRFVTDEFPLSPLYSDPAVPEANTAGPYKLAAVDREALMSGKLALQLFVHHEPDSLNMSGYTLYRKLGDSIRETRVAADGTLTEKELP
ncbi:hypothetical protein PM3016_4684 [Paenibacillus mucilaginosus 3016]|uniref:Copper amine oxidase-like N-terminal domain-containing protein n=1 Tax=Paenibacillus mucilaginosus 3016 TaxID=1116391 RepID=H6NG09_9BACL|nr:stalk domain-containing protein [Paenibacillus mucilaginosus]AFC31428.1 hypothetical protein PM3016_4684 [Paenibacillus mucilaginosus 3016]WFA19977.1 copper amine oxidase N-terminal domain-containing protein [Paenibacillus mucilaginosus]